MASDSGEEDDEKVNNETCLIAQASSEICLGVDLEPDEWIKDSGCSKHMTGNRKLFACYKEYNGGQICDNKCRVTFSEHDSEITKDDKVIGYSQNSKAYIILNKHTRKIEESLNVTFDETPPPSKTSPLVDDDLDEEEAIKVTEKKNLKNDIEDETLKVDEMVNIKESMNHPLKNAIGNLNQRTLRSQAQNQSNFFCFISTIEPKNVNEALADERTKWVFRNKLDENGIVSRNKARLVAQGYNQQEGIDYDETYVLVRLVKTCVMNLPKIMHDEFEMSMMVNLNFFLGLQIKQMEDDEECESVDSTKYRGMIGSLFYPTASIPDIMLSVCLCARFQEDPKTSHLEAVKRIFRYIKGTTLRIMKQTALAISTTEAEYVSAEKACQQALWMKQALID
ncbi:retrovirus-related pol polyprotein from transposon TNT 1-94 [Tanacetum coccineum]|uniref:Retrovirus-related pol polyprotein from transposon TNT 1-94 n=1 Tax=Tanacetum coccineum TaxID=301880 RepID=A0ABQ5B7G8_9ASTR